MKIVPGFLCKYRGEENRVCMAKDNNVIKFRTRREVNIGLVVAFGILVLLGINIYRFMTMPHLSLYEVQAGSAGSNSSTVAMILRPETELMFRVNVIAVIEMVQLVARLMQRNGGGSIVNIASVTAVLGSPGQSAYSATKGAIISFTKSAAKELAPLGIRVNAVAPGIVKTERFAELYEQSGEKIDARIQRIALGRLGTPEDIAHACAFLGSDRATYISGQILGVDGCASI